MEISVADFWDREALRFDEQADHGLQQPSVHAAWAGLLLPLMPSAPATVADLGCGTGSLSVLLADEGHNIHGLDISPQMLSAAQRKAAGVDLSVEFDHGDASTPPYTLGAFDVVLARHVLWALPDPDAAFARWVQLLRPGGRILLIEGRWSTGAGIPARVCRGLVLRYRDQADIVPLKDPALWGRPIDDERYLLISHR
jgi:ubiquinone/menaquinone biosynthesis C-methylase UbiE